MASDPFYYLNDFYLPMDGADGGTTFTNVAPNGTGLISRFGDTKTVTATLKFGTASAYFDGTGDFLTRNGSSATLSMGTGDFTVDFFVDIESNQGANDIIFTLSSGGSGIRIKLYDASTPCKLLFETNAGTAQIQSLGTVSFGAWHHVRVTRSSGVFYFFVDGVLQGSDSSQTSYNITSQNFYLGSGHSGATPFKGWIDEFRIVKGHCAATADYAVPTEALNDKLDPDTITFTDALAPPAIVAHGLTDTVSTSDALALPTITPPALTETVTLTDAASGVRDADPLTDTITLTDSASAVQAATAAPLADTITLTDELGAVLILSLADTITLTDTLLAEVSVDPLEDTITFTDALSGIVSHVAAPLADTITLTDTLTDGRVADPLEDTITLTDAVSGQLALVAVGLEDALTLTDALDGTLGLTAVIEDVITLTDALGVPDLALVAAPLLDTVTFTDALVLTEQRLIVTNAETWAVSEYEFPLAVTGLAEFRGTLYVAAADGLYALDAAEDESGAVVWTLATGFSNLGSDLLKRVTDLNIQARTEGDATLIVTVDRTGIKQELTYRLPPLTRESYRDGVTKIGRGLQSVYWALGLRGEGPAEVDQLRPRIEPLSRRR